MKNLLRTTFSCLFFFSILISAQGQPLPVDKDVVTGTLDNGVTYYIQKNSKPEKRAELRLFVKAGSVQENDDQQGLAHFVEHMAFNGTKNFKKNELVNYLEKLGIKFGPELNAQTGFDQTIYMLKVPTDSVDILAKGFQVLEDWAHNLSFDPEEIDKERGVVIEEWRLGRGAQMRMMNKLLPILFKESKYAERLPIGKKDIIESADYQTIKSFYHDWYRPDLIGVAAVGDFNIKDIESYIKQHFAGIKPPENEKEEITYNIPKHKETYFGIASDKEAQFSTVSVYYLQDPKIVKDVEDYKNRLVHTIFYGILNDRLNELTASADPPFAYGYSGSERLVKSSDLSYLVALVKEGGIDRGLEALLREAERIYRFGITQTEVDRQKKNLLRLAEKSLDEKDKTESSRIINEIENNFLYNQPLISVEDNYKLINELLPGINLEDVNSVSSEMLTPENRIVLVTSPEKDSLKIPDNAELSAVIDKINSENITPYIDKVASEPLVKNVPSPSTIVSSISTPSLNLTEWTLGNGVKVIIKPTDFKNDEVVFSAFSPGGSSEVRDNDFLSAQYATSLLMESGLDGLNRTELEKYLTGKIVNVNPYIGFYFEGMQGGASPKDIETLFQLIYTYFIEPRIDSTGYSSFTTKLKSFLANRSSNPQAAFKDTMQVTLSNYHFRSRPVTVNMLDEINPDKSLSIYKDRFGDANDFTFVFAGNIDTSAVKPLVETYLGGLPSHNRVDVPVDLKFKDIKGSISKIVKKGIEPKSSVAITYVGNMDFTRKTEYLMQSLVDILRIKLRETIREDKSGTYGVYCYKQIYRIPQAHYDINFGFGCDPRRVDELVETFHTVLDSIKTFGPDETIMTKVKESQRRQRELDIKKNSFWIGIISDYLENNEDPSEILNYNKWIDEMTAEDIKECANEYLGDDVVKVVLYPAEESSQ